MQAEEIKAAAERKGLRIGKKISVQSFYHTQGNAIAFTPKKKGRVCAMYPHIFGIEITLHGGTVKEYFPYSIVLGFGKESVNGL